MLLNELRVVELQNLHSWETDSFSADSIKKYLEKEKKYVGKNGLQELKGGFSKETINQAKY